MLPEKKMNTLKMDGEGIVVSRELETMKKKMEILQSEFLGNVLRKLFYGKFHFQNFWCLQKNIIVI